MPLVNKCQLPPTTTMRESQGIAAQKFASIVQDNLVKFLFSLPNKGGKT
jgi:hypothetical protein